MLNKKNPQTIMECWS